jgi:hypothetical protein
MIAKKITPRDYSIYAFYVAGIPLKEIAGLFKTTRERVRQTALRVQKIKQKQDGREHIGRNVEAQGSNH